MKFIQNGDRFKPRKGLEPIVDRKMVLYSTVCTKNYGINLVEGEI